MKKLIFILTIISTMITYADDKVYVSIDTVNYDAVPINYISKDGVIVFGKNDIVVSYFTKRVTIDSSTAWYIVTKVDKDTVYQIDSVEVPTTERKTFVLDRTISWPTLEHLDTTYNK